MRQRRGVTLIELLVVLGIVAVLAVAFTVRMSRARATASEDALQGTARAMGAAISAYYLANGCYPPDAPNYTSGQPGGPAAMPSGMQPYVSEWPYAVMWDYYNAYGYGAIFWWRESAWDWIREAVFYGRRCWGFGSGRQPDRRLPKPDDPGMRPFLPCPDRVQKHEIAYVPGHV